MDAFLQYAHIYATTRISEMEPNSILKGSKTLSDTQQPLVSHIHFQSPKPVVVVTLLKKSQRPMPNPHRSQTRGQGCWWHQQAEASCTWEQCCHSVPVLHSNTPMMLPGLSRQTNRAPSHGDGPAAGNTVLGAARLHKGYSHSTCFLFTLANTNEREESKP